MALRLLSTFFMRGHQASLLSDIQRQPAEPINQDLLIAAKQAIESTTDTIVSGPNLILVIAVAASAFLFRRLLDYLGIGGRIAVFFMFIMTILSINVALHLHLSSLQFWNTAAIFDSFDEARLPAVTNDLLNHIVDSGGVTAYAGDQIVALVLAGFLMIWIRFLIVGASNVTVSKVSRSWGIGFLANLILLILGGLNGIPLAPFVAIHFVLGAFTLALSYLNGVRPETGVKGKLAPWTYSLAGTMFILCLVGLLFWLITKIDISPIFNPLFDLLGEIIGRIMVIILTPIFWLLKFFLSLLGPQSSSSMAPEPCGELLKAVNAAISKGDTILADQLNKEYKACLAPPAQNLQDEASQVPPWIGTALKSFVLFVLGYAFYKIFLFIVGLVRGNNETDDEASERYTTPNSSGSLLELIQDLLPRRKSTSKAWMQRHAIYSLWGELEKDGSLRGMPRSSDETVDEYAGAHQKYLGTPAHPIAQLFDKARYGRIFPDENDLHKAQNALIDWRKSSLITEELKDQVQAARNPDFESDRISDAEAALRERNEKERDQRLEADDPDALPY